MKALATTKAITHFQPKRLTLLIFFLLGTSTAVISAPNNWTGGVGNWNGGTNWSNGAVPAPADDVFIDNGDILTNSDVTQDISATINSLTIDAGDSLTTGNGIDMSISGVSIINNGAWLLNSSGTTTSFRFADGATLDGNGEFVLGDSTGNQVFGNTGVSNILTNGTNHTIRGAGRLLVNTGNMINDGNIFADQTSAMTIDPNSSFTNNGFMRATGAGGLTLGAATYNNNSVIEALDGSQVSVSGGATIEGGTLDTQGSGVINLLGGARLTNVTNTGALLQENSASAFISGTINNTGTWSVNSTGTIIGADTRFDGGAEFSGSGEIILTGSTNNRIRGNITSTDTLTNGADHTIRGTGKLLDNFGNMINNGNIIADQNSVLEIFPNSSFVNNGSLRATGSGGLRLRGIITNNSVIEATNGSQVLIGGGATVTGGTLNTQGTGIINLDGGKLNDVTNEGAIEQDVGTDSFISGTITNNGTWTLLGGTFSDIRFDDGAAFSGNGEVTLNNTTITANGVATNTLTNGINHTIRGSGRLLDNFGNMINRGSIIADLNSNFLVIDASTSFTNDGTLSATGNAGIGVSAGAFTNSGTVNITSNSKLNKTGAYVQTAGTTLVNGNLFTSLGVELQGGSLAGSGALSGAGITNTGGVITPGDAGAGILSVNSGDYSQLVAGTFDIEIGGLISGTEYDVFDIKNGNASLDGALNVSLINGFIPNPGDSFDILLANSILGEFDPNQLFFPVFSGMTFDVLYGGNFVRLTTTAAVPVPAAFWLLLSGIAALSGFARRPKTGRLIE